MQPKAGAVKAPELSPRGRGRCSNQTSRSCTSWRDTSKHCTRYKSFNTFQMDYNIRMYVDIFCFVCSHLLQSLKKLIFGNGGSTTHAWMPLLSFWYLHVLIWCTLPNFDYKFNYPNFHACHKKLRGCLDCDYVCIMLPHYFCHTCLTWVAQIVRHTLACLRESCHNFCVYDMWGSLLIKKFLS